VLDATKLKAHSLRSLGLSWFHGTAVASFGLQGLSTIMAVDTRLCVQPSGQCKFVS
jgi:hypothetical protein